ncbi:hypothetical protein SAMN04489727_5747 [Amycolatopsis tolypomycina]|uniref:Uncharacterized protein n=1 Tax=Amycolatopsis tolypomycina TaxID=208445 RepID=A0A1H4WSB8_9PSEU|nr:hypothetical protein [Amycolatopsis tolypomycina]SEC95618.1 hypothetical protein SAMN04489727_5747 [Amycolatopsis tolypomycina]
MKKTTETPTWLRTADVIPCPSWCVGGHREAQHPDDRRHFSKAGMEFEPVLAEPSLEDLTPVYGGRQLVPVRLTVGMDQGYREVGPQISITPESTAHGRGVVFTVAEAEQVGRMLLKLAKQARKAEGAQR